jgi:xanthine dehydrogenase accessory factor
MDVPSQSKHIGDAIRNLLESGSRGVLATLVTSEASASLIGSKLVVEEDGKCFGSLGEGELDDAVAEHAYAFLRTHEEARIFEVSDFAPGLTRFADAGILFERLESEPRLVIAGAGHVGASLARLAALVGYRVTLIDDRGEFVKRELFSATSEQNIELIDAEDWHDAIGQAIGNGWGVSVAIVTRGHKQDEECLRASLAANPAYVGMIGSKRRTNIVLDKLREEGTSEEQLIKVHAPIGLDIGAVSPEEVALAILAEIVAERRRGSGGSLSAWRRV